MTSEITPGEKANASIFLRLVRSVLAVFSTVRSELFTLNKTDLGAGKYLGFVFCMDHTLFHSNVVVVYGYGSYEGIHASVELIE